MSTSSEKLPVANRPEASAVDPAVDAVLGAILLTSKALAAYGREDLVARLAAARQRLEDPAFRVLVVGEFKQGKSSLVNALLDVDVCPVDDDIATSAPTAVRYDEQRSARVLYKPSDDDPDGKQRSEEIDVDRIREFVTEATNPANERGVQWVEVGVPSPMLADGLVLVDTPGVGGLGSVHGAITAAALPMADGVLFLTDASQEFSEPEMTFLKQAVSMCPNVCCVLTKTDFYPAWRKILELDQGHLQNAGVAMEILPVSSVLRRQARESGDADARRGVRVPRAARCAAQRDRRRRGAPRRRRRVRRAVRRPRPARGAVPARRSRRSGSRSTRRSSSRACRARTSAPSVSGASPRAGR